MKSEVYDVEIIVAEKNLCMSKCSCMAGGGEKVRIVCVHTLVLPYLLTLLLTSGHLAHHILIELANRWSNDSNKSLCFGSSCTSKAMIRNLIISTGDYDMVDNTDLKTMLSQYLVGTEKQKANPLVFPALKLLGAIRNIPESARQSTRKRALEATKYSRVKCSDKKGGEHKQSEKVTIIPYCLGDDLISENRNESYKATVHVPSDKVQDDHRNSIVSKA